MERRSLTRLVVVLLVAAAAVGGGYAAWRAGPGAPAPRTPPVTNAGEATTPAAVAPSRIVPPDTRIRVEVVNATRVRGLARRATFYLRDVGFDVVDFRTTREQRDSTLILDRSGHPEWAALAARALGGARVESRPDSSRYLDLTILLGATWRPPAQPFYP